MSSLLFNAPIFVLIFFIGMGMGKQQEATCDDTVSALMVWLVFATLIPLTINVATFVLIILTISQMRKMKKITESIASSTHRLSQTAIRVGIGNSAKKALLDFARTKDELKMLLPATTIDKKNV
ncbi:unnamed protein product, partial [Mesorhabditis belari]|uniref:Uncharacterized protein n=1 Tax=Mesorhabditis belari TaxID=2138241 RepID=A0AAF3FES1_9BILA